MKRRILTAWTGVKKEDGIERDMLQMELTCLMYLYMYDLVDETDFRDVEMSN